MLHSPQILLVPGKAAVIAAPSASGWDPAGVGTGVILSTTLVTNDTATNTSLGTFEVMRGTSVKTTGKLAFEIKLVSGAVNAMVGLIDQTTAGGVGLDAFSVPNGIKFWINNGTVFVNGADFSAGPGVAGSTGVANGDIYGVQADLTSGKVWVSLNGTSIIGDPVAGTNNPLAIANNHPVCPSFSSESSVNEVMQLFTGTLAFPVSGYSSWGP